MNSTFNAYKIVALTQDRTYNKKKGIRNKDVKIKGNKKRYKI